MRFALFSSALLLGLASSAGAEITVGEPPDEESTEAPVSPVPPAQPVAPAPPRAKPAFEGGMLRLPGGTFTMGSRDPTSPANERPVHTEVVAAFWLDKTEVTVGAYRACVATGRCAAPIRTSAQCTYDLGDLDLPVSCMHWSEADGFCSALGKRLPREAEWEFAARGTSDAPYPWGGAATSCAFAATLKTNRSAARCNEGRPAKVGSHPAGASGFGVLDLSGNVTEWMSDWYAEHPASGAAPHAGGSHVLRGGGWLSAPSAARVTARDWASSMEAGPNVGFRCARD